MTEPQADEACALCPRIVKAADVEDQHCFGCGETICDHHFGDTPLGPHDVEAHRGGDDD